MRALDRFLQRWRVRVAGPHVRSGDRVLDIGCFDGLLLRGLSGRIRKGVGIDPLAEEWSSGNVEVVRGTCPGSPRFEDGSFDTITMLAVLEHIPGREALAEECARLLSPGGRVVITVPRPAVDHLLAVLTALRLIDGMSLEEHSGYDIEQTPALFGGAGLRLVRRSSFQLGLNCLFVFEKPAA